MRRIVFLGTSRCLPTEHRDNTSILFETSNDSFLVDLSGKPFQKLLKCQTNLNNLNNILISHFHVDHCYGLPSLISSFQLSGRERELKIMGLPEVIKKLKNLMHAFEWETWGNITKLYPVIFEKISKRFHEKVYDGPDLAVFSCLNSHIIPNLSIKVQFKVINKFVVYTSDTYSPNDNIINLAKDTDYLIQEVNYLSNEHEGALINGHSTTTQAGLAVRQMNVKKLFLVHHGLDKFDDIEKMKKEVGQGGYDIYVPDDMEEIEIK